MVARRMSFDVTFTFIGMDMRAKGAYTPGDPGRLSGPPENCYPPDPAEVDVTELTCDGTDMSPLLGSEVATEIECRIIDTIEEEASED